MPGGIRDSKRVLHRDLSAANVFLSAADDIKVGDFGLSKSSGTSVSVHGKSVVGTPNYFSPEMVSRHGMPIVQSRFFSCGRVMRNEPTRE